ncbi:MAG TPA: bifunctional 4-hydroxy-2-oxoglutarate aldolase/2-dehydro-3-deoxy-phosphogluconate aldolase [Armatimonadota bacterium]|jgi:2-dehydro-3-deoxyphosphogluconate aldolase/(4S)-4-hydroxy-2-oxoglutarate aldolase
MMRGSEVTARIEQERVVAVIRTQAPEDLLPLAEAIEAGGIGILEFTLTSPKALQALEQLTDAASGRLLVGVGTVLDTESCRAAILAGASFVVSPTLNLDVIRLCRRYSVPVIPGAFTPTEVLTAWESGADLVKVFPAGRLGPGYLRDLHGPLPQVKLVPTGGVGPENAVEYLLAGAAAVAVGGKLTAPGGPPEGRLARVTEAAESLVASVRATPSTTPR